MATFTPDDYLKKKEQERDELAARQRDYGTYQESDYVKDLREKALADKDALDNFGDFQFSKQDLYDRLQDSYMNRPQFNYDLDGDSLYQMYKDKYIKGGKLAMADTMGQAAVLTGGYGNSYAATVGNQAYQAYLGQLNDVVPELYQLALQRYQMEGQDLLDRLGLLSADRSTEYGEWSDRYGMANDAYNRNYGFYNDERNRENADFETGYSRLTDALSYAASDYDSEYNRQYSDFRNNVSDQQFAQQLASSKSSSSGSGSGSKSGNYSVLSSGIKEAKAKGNGALYNFLLSVAEGGYSYEDVLDAMTANGVPMSFLDDVFENAKYEITKEVGNPELSPKQQVKLMEEMIENYKRNPELYRQLRTYFDFD